VERGKGRGRKKNAKHRKKGSQGGRREGSGGNFQGVVAVKKKEKRNKSRLGKTRGKKEMERRTQWMFVQIEVGVHTKKGGVTEVPQKRLEPEEKRGNGNISKEGVPL